MITFFRKFLTSWFALGLLGLVLLAFVVTGIGGDPTGGGLGGGSGVAKVGGTSLSEARLLSEFDRTMRRARQSDPKLTARDVARQGGVSEVLEQLIATTAIEDFGRNNGIAVSDRAVDGEIASVDAFRVDGKFDPATYKRLLAEQRLSERELRDGLHGDLIRKQVVTPVLAGAQVPRAMAAPYAALLLERRDGAVAVVPAAAMPAPPAPTEAQVAAFYKANAARYTTPERRGFRYALLDQAKLAGGVTVADADIQKYYDANKDQYGGVETRRLEQVVVPDEARANALIAAVRAGRTFAAAAVADGFAAADLDIGQQTRAKFAAATSPAVAAAAFAAPAGGLTAPVRSPFGWHVVRVVAIAAAKPEGLVAARPEIAAKLRAERAAQQLSDTVGKIEDALSSRTSFADVARTHGLTIAQVPPLTRAGIDPADPAYALPPAALPLVAKAFDADPADGAVLQQLGKEQFAIVELGDIVPPAPVPLAGVRPQVVAAWGADQRLAAARRTAEAVVAATAKGTSFAAAVAAQKLPPPRPLGGRRIDLAQQQQVPLPVQAFLVLGAGRSRVVAAPGGQGYVVVHVDKVTPGDLATAPQLVDSARQQFAQSAPDEISSAFARAVERDLGVTRNPAAIAAVIARIVGDPGTAN